METSTAEHLPNGPRGLGQNETYVGQRLLFQRAGQVEVDLADAVSGADAKRILKQAVIGSVLIGLASSLFGGILALMASRAGGDAAMSFLGLAYLLPWAWIALVLFVPRDEVLSDWHMLLDARAPVADTAYGVVYRSLVSDRQVPAVVDYRRVRVGPPVPGVRNTLRVAIGKYRCYISVFPFGNDLFLGWALWRRQLPVVVVLRWIASLFGKDPGFSGLIEMEPIKAMREAVHNALRQGVEASVLGQRIPLAETFGQDIPVFDGDVPVTLADPPPRTVTVRYPVDVYSQDDAPVGRAEPGTRYEVLHDDQVDRLVLRDPGGAVAVLKDRSAVQW